MEGVRTYHVGAHVHRRPTMDTRVTHRCSYILSLEPVHTPSLERSPVQPLRHATPYRTASPVTCRLRLSTKPERKGGGEVLLLKEIITNYWAYTEQVNFPVVLLSPRSMGGKRGVGETATFEEYNKTKSDLNNANVETVSEAAQL